MLNTNIQLPTPSSRLPTKAMILAAGEGTRLKPLTLETPKVLLPVGGVPLICHTLSWLRRYGISEVAINLYHLGEKIMDFLGTGSPWDMEIAYSIEESLLGTAGGVKRVECFFDGNFVVVYGDVLTDLDLSAMFQLHQAGKAMATLALLEVPNPVGAGVVKVSPNGRVSSFVEKPPKGADVGKLVNGGVYILEREVLNHIPGTGFCDFAYDLIPGWIETGLPIYGYLLGPEEHLVDIGTPERYQQVNRDIEEGRLRLNCGYTSRIPG